MLAVVFTGNSCPASQLYEARLRTLADDYRDRGVTLVAINPNRPAALQLQDLSFSDVGESLDDMKTRATHRRISYPYLSDGEAQAVARTFGVVATPHIFVFDQARTLQVPKDGLTTAFGRTPSGHPTRGTPSTPCWPASPRPLPAPASTAAP